MNKRFSRHLDELPRIFKYLEDAARAFHLDADTAFALSLAVEELFTNVLKHNPAGTGDVELAVDRDGACLQVEFMDFDSPPFNPASVPPVDTRAPLHDRKPGGLGLHILSHIMDTVESRHENDTNTIRLTKTLPHV